MMLLIKISLLFSLLLPDSGKWQRIQTPECISFLFPNTPEIQTTGYVPPFTKPKI